MDEVLDDRLHVEILGRCANMFDFLVEVDEFTPETMKQMWHAADKKHELEVGKVYDIICNVVRKPSLNMDCITTLYNLIGLQFQDLEVFNSRQQTLVCELATVSG